MGPKSKTSEFIYAHAKHDNEDCLLWPYGHDGGGYARAKVKGFSTRLAHRIMCEIVHGPAPFDGAVARHKCGMGHEGCVNPTHLEWGSVAQNSADMEAHGTKPVGQMVPRAVLNDCKVRKIRALIAQGKSQRFVARQIGVCAGTVQAIVERRTWGHVK